MQRWEAPMGDAEGDLAGPWPGNAPELLVRAAYRVHRVEELPPVPLAQQRLEIHVAPHRTAPHRCRAQRPSPSRRISSR
jgi:hypothetical protein